MEGSLHPFDTTLPKSQIPTSDSRYRWLGIIILLLAFGGFGGWAVTANLAVAVVAAGEVSVESYKKTIQHREGGIVKKLFVQNGDHVEAGDALLTLDKTQVFSQLQIERWQYLTNRVARMRLLAAQQGADSLTFPATLRNSDLPRVKKILAVQRALFQSRRKALEEALTALDEHIAQMREQIGSLESTIAMSRSLMASLKAEAEDLRRLFKAGFVTNRRLLELERQILQLRGEITQYRSDIARLKSQISEDQARKQVKSQEFQAKVSEELHQAQANIIEAKERITALSEQVKRTVVTAPVAGIVVGMTVHTAGAIIGPSDPIMYIVPSGDGFVVEARIPAHDIDKIYPGQYAEIRFTAFDRGSTIVIEGEVTRVSADSFRDEITGAPYYKVRIQVTETGKHPMPNDMQLLAGMPAEVMIKTGERTFSSYVIKPITDMLARAMQTG